MAGDCQIVADRKTELTPAGLISRTGRMLKSSGRIVVAALIALISTNAFAAETGEGGPELDPKAAPPHVALSHVIPARASRARQTPAIALYDKGQLEEWYRSDMPRGNRTTLGDYGLHINSISNHLPVEAGDGYKAIICAGAGCPIKVPFTFSSAQLSKIKHDMAAAETKAHCETDTAKCEMIGLKTAAAAMETMVHNERLSKLSLAQQQAYSVDPEDEIGKATVQDCVDQTTNGISYLYILAQKGMMRHHTIIEPGVTEIHYWTRVKSDQGQILSFDLYHRGDFGVPPIVSCESCP